MSESREGEDEPGEAPNIHLAQPEADEGLADLATRNRNAVQKSPSVPVSGGHEYVVSPPQSAHSAENPRESFVRSNDSRETVWDFIRLFMHGGVKLSDTAFMVVLVTILFGLFVAQTVAGIFSARIASDRASLSSSTSCGIWELDYNVGGEASIHDDLHNYQKESRASQYARDCYSPSGITNSQGCRSFYNQSIGFEAKYDQVCPFGSPELCLDGLYSAVTFDTGHVDSSIIGVNAPNTHKFRRKTSCSPLNMTAKYIQRYSSDDVENTTYRYYYGPKDASAFTFQTSGNPFQWLVPVYSVKYSPPNHISPWTQTQMTYELNSTYFSSLYPEDDYWRPLPDLRPPIGSTLTIIFVSSNHIYHTTPSLDPIFPATKPRYFPPEREPYYYNSDPFARALACVDTTELCSPNGQTCWSMLPNSASHNAAYWLMKLSLENSNIYDSIKWRLGTALLAQESVSQFISQPLPANQWAVEVSQLFATSLARIQYDAWSIAHGEERERSGYVEVTPDEAKGRLCRLYKFNSIGYTNVSLLGFIGLPLAAFVVYVLSWEACSVKWGKRAPKKDKGPPEPMIVEKLSHSVGDVLSYILVGIFKRLPTWLSKKWKQWWANRNIRSRGADVESP